MEAWEILVRKHWKAAMHDSGESRHRSYSALALRTTPARASRCAAPLSHNFLARSPFVAYRRATGAKKISSAAIIVSGLERSDRSIRNFNLSLLFQSLTGIVSLHRSNQDGTQVYPSATTTDPHPGSLAAHHFENEGRIHFHALRPRSCLVNFVCPPHRGLDVALTRHFLRLCSEL